MYDKIRNDQYIIDIYNKISVYEDENDVWAYHDLKHVLNVVSMTEKLLTDLNCDKALIEEAKIAALLHDLGCIEGKNNHAHRSYSMAKKYFEKNKINLKNENLILDAIKTHSDGFDTDNKIAVILILCDKLDIKKTRIDTTTCQVNIK